MAAGVVAYDRTEVPLGVGAQGLLDRFVVPSGIDVLSVTIVSDPRLFAPPLWFGQEVTDYPEFEPSHLATAGLPNNPEPEISNTALEALLDWVEGRSLYSFRMSAQPSPNVSAGDAQLNVNVQAEEGMDENRPLSGEVLEPEAEHPTDLTAGAASSESSELDPSAALSDEAHQAANGAPLARSPSWRANLPQLEDGIARLARSLAPPRSRKSDDPSPAERTTRSPTLN